MSDELDQLRARKLAELQRSYQDQVEQDAAVQQQVEALEHFVKQRLSKEALLRYGNLKAAHPEKAMQLLVILGQVIQSQNVAKVTDAQLRQLLIKLGPKKRDFKITRK